MQALLLELVIRKEEGLYCFGHKMGDSPLGRMEDRMRQKISNKLTLMGT